MGKFLGVNLAAFLAALRADVRSAVPVIVWLTISLAVAISGPFGSYASLTFAERLLYWPLLIGLAVVVSAAIRAFVHGTLNMSSSVGGTVLTAVLIAVTLTPPLYLAVQWLFDPVFGGLAGFFEIFLVVSCVSLGVCALRVSITTTNDSAPQEEPTMAETTLEAPRLLRRIEPVMQGQIWAMTVRDHYVDVQTDKGKSSILMRFSDAMEEVQPLLGAQVHRSHWVAWAGVGSVCRESGKVILHLKNGHQIPVSRNHRDKVDAQFPPLDGVKDAAA